MTTIHFKGLNGMRAIAAITVIIAHINIHLNLFGLELLATSDLAGFGVSIFFTLSGFLITYLLLKEQEQFNRINIAKFYIRRALRIWPLYFFYIVLVLLIVRPNFTPTVLGEYLVFAPNIPYVFSSEIKFIGHYWSLGVEEQFYFFWPLFFLFSKNLQRSVFVFLVAFMGLKLFLNLYYGSYSEPYTFIYVTRFSCMAIGALGACFFFNNHKVLKIINTVYFEVTSWYILLLVTISKFHLFSLIDHEIISLVTLVIILRQVSENRLISLDNKVLMYLGKISFGMYVFHPLVIYLLSLFLNNVRLCESWKHVTIYFSVLVCTILISHLSNKYMESYFLRLKTRFSLIKSET